MTADTYRLGVDIGGTFTDFVLVAEGSGGMLAGKSLTNPSNPSLGLVSGLDALLQKHTIVPDQVVGLVHGTTLATNAIIQRRGARVALITTSGFRDVLEIGKERRYDVYDLMIHPPEPLAARALRAEVPERVLHDGTLLHALDEDALARIVEKLVDEGVEAIAVCFLHSYANPVNEQRAKTVIQNVAPDVFVSLSSEVVPEIREFERMSTTVANAYVQPLMQAYLEILHEALKGMGYDRGYYVMLSSGGITTAETAARFPIRVVESGPAGGALAASFSGQLAGHANVIAFDMGGTTAKICLIDDGKPTKITDFEVARVKWYKNGSGLPVKAPMIELIEIGTGGGSIARIDDMGLLKVGPTSAGAQPGPVCYGLGGEEPTVTDADLVLGYLDPGYFLGGDMSLDADAAYRSIEARIAAPLGMTVLQAAWGIHEIANETMANAAKLYAAQQGKDLSAYAMVASGGAGPVHAHRIARKLGVRQVVCPVGAGVASAFGLLVAPMSFEVARTYSTALTNLDTDRLNATFADMEEQALGVLHVAGIMDQDITISRTASMRYEGQGYEIEVAVPGGNLEPEDVERMKEAFERRYAELYGSFDLTASHAVHGLTWRVTASGPEQTVRGLELDGKTPSAMGAQKGVRLAYEGVAEAPVEWPVFDRYLLEQGATLRGPAIVEERECTIVIGRGSTARIDASGQLLMTL